MNIRDLNGKSICILGYGREGQAMTDALEKYAPEAEVTICDQNEKLQITNHKSQLGDDWLHDLDRFDCIIRSPGIPPNSQLSTLNSQLTNSSQIFLDSIDPQTTVIGVTGSKGKSTTASLIAAILKEAGKEVLLVGNIGVPAISALPQLTTRNSQLIVVQEFSSAQLMLMTSSPHISIITSFFPEHLDYHGSLEAYAEAKTHICSSQTADDTVFYYDGSDGAEKIAAASPGHKKGYSAEDSPIAIIDTNLVGVHNLCNIAGAAAVARHIGIDDTVIVEAVRTFEGLPHRLHNLGKHDGIVWVDDAISTTPDSTIAAIHALAPNVHILIAGGKDRGTDFKQLGEVIGASSIEHVIVMGETGPKIKEAITNSSITIHEVSSMEEAVETAKLQTTNYKLQTPTVLLSPASPSYDMFKDFEEKGDTYKSLVTRNS